MHDCHFRDGRAETAPQTRTGVSDKKTIAEADAPVHSLEHEPRMPHIEYSSVELDKAYPSLEAVEDLDLPDLSRLEDNTLYAAGMTVVQAILREMSEVGRTRRQGGVSEINDPNAKEAGRSGRSEEELRKDRSGFRQAGAHSGVATVSDNLGVCALYEHHLSISSPHTAHNAQARHVRWHLPPHNERDVVAVDAGQMRVQRPVLPGVAKERSDSIRLKRRREAHATVQTYARSDSNERVISQLPRLCSNDVDPSGAAYSRARTAVRPGKAEAESGFDSG